MSHAAAWQFFSQGLAVDQLQLLFRAKYAGFKRSAELLPRPRSKRDLLMCYLCFGPPCPDVPSVREVRCRVTTAEKMIGEGAECDHTRHPLPSSR